MSRGVFGLPGRNKNEFYTKLTVVMCCQISARRSVAPSSGDFCRRPSPRQASEKDKELKKKNNKKSLLDPFRSRGPSSAIV